MWKPIVAGTAALVIVGSTLVLAQNRPDGARRWMPNLEDMRAFGDARLAALKAGLALSAEQEKNWPAFEQAARDFQKLRLDRLRAGVDARRDCRSRSNDARGNDTRDPVARMQERATAMAESGAALRKLADATGPLYGSLDENQKRRFGVLSRMGAMGAMGGDDGRDRMRGMHRWMHDGGRFGPRRTENEDMDRMPMRPLGFTAPIRGEERL